MVFKSLNFFLLKFYSFFENYYLTILVFLSCGSVWASIHYSSVIKTSFSVLLPTSGFISRPEGSLKFTGSLMASHLIIYFFLPLASNCKLEFPRNWFLRHSPEILYYSLNSSHNQLEGETSQIHGWARGNFCQENPPGYHNLYTQRREWRHLNPLLAWHLPINMLIADMKVISGIFRDSACLKTRGLVGVVPEVLAGAGKKTYSLCSSLTAVPVWSNIKS